MKIEISLGSCRSMNLMNLNQDDILLEDIAHSLANQCRFNGHTRYFYSVAQHSVHMATYFRKRWPGKDLALEALMHDAHEAYVGDIASPIKRELPAFQQIERTVDEAIRERFELRASMPDEVKQLDIRMAATEYKQLIRHKLPESWGAITPLDIKIRAWDPVEAELIFLRTALSLGVLP